MRFEQASISPFFDFCQNRELLRRFLVPEHTGQSFLYYYHYPIRHQNVSKTFPCKINAVSANNSKSLHFLKILAALAIALAVPIIPFLLWEEAITTAAHSWRAAEPSPVVVATGIFLLLSLDVFLPVPSSLVNTWAGAELGMLPGGIVCFAGLTSGAVLGFSIAQRAGLAFRDRWAAQSEATGLTQFAEHWGPATLIATRALPVLAEASVVLLGFQGMSWKKFLPPVLLANAGIAIAYASLGQLAADQEWLVIAMAISAGAPLLLSIWARKWLRHQAPLPTDND